MDNVVSNIETKKAVRKPVSKKVPNQKVVSNVEKQKKVIHKDGLKDVQDTPKRPGKKPVSKKNNQEFGDDQVTPEKKYSKPSI
uniref:Uncharacterized protein n=1 Tax=Panagrolaimus superbus TaxID=310955 RepID=A0A914YJG1_9BILA